MKLQKRFLRKHRDKDYFKFMVNIPPKIIKQAGFKEGEDLDIKVEGKTIKIKKKTEN